MKYLCVIEAGTQSKGRPAFCGYCLDISSNVAGKLTREAVIESLREGIILSIEGLREDGLPVPEPTSAESDVQKEADTDELVWVEIPDDA